MSSGNLEEQVKVHETLRAKDLEIDKLKKALERIKADQSRGRIRDIESIEDLPKALVDSFFEGLTTAPQDFAIMAMGFIIGYEGYDLVGMLLKPVNEMVTNAVKGMVSGAGELARNTAIGAFDMANMPIQMGGTLQDIAKLAAQVADGTGDLTKILTLFPNKHITPATKMAPELGPGVSYWGPPPEGYDPEKWPPYGTTLSKLEDEKTAHAADDDWWKWEFEQIAAELKLKVITGCIGGITAYALTRPGVLQSIGQSISTIVAGALEGAGEAVPF